MDINSNKKQRVSFISFIQPAIFPFFIFLLSGTIFVPLMFCTYKTEDQLVAWLIAIVTISFTCIPTFILQMNYFLNDKNKSLEINNIKQKLIILEDTQIQIIDYNEIVVIEKYCGNIITSKLPFNSYYYYKIIVKNKKTIFLSRMIAREIEKDLKSKIRFEFISVYFPLIIKENY